MRPIPLDEGDLRWVFPELADHRRVLDILHRAAGCMEQLADHLGVRPSWTGTGLEFCIFPARQTAHLLGCAETGEVSFIAELTPPRPKYLGDGVITEPPPPPPWSVEGEISVRCDHVVDCCMHQIEMRPETEHPTAVEAASDLLAVTSWLLRRGTAEPASSWRQRDASSRHQR